MPLSPIFGACLPTAVVLPNCSSPRRPRLLSCVEARLAGEASRIATSGLGQS